jgi:2-(1,2-epoxy-1,2-dihydrophenyl)acetyl-CoA isomerase
MSNDILSSVHGQVATITFNRPESRNAISRDMVQALTVLVRAYGADPDVRCLVFRGAGEHFSGGGDVKGFGEVLGLSPDERRQMFETRVGASADLFAELEALRVPVVAVARGAVAGAGLAFVMASDFALVSDTSFYVFAHTRIGIPLDSGLSYFLPRVVGSRKARELTLSGARIAAAEALAIGLVSRVLPDADLDVAADSLIASLASGATRAFGLSKELLSVSLQNDVRGQVAAEARAVGACAGGPDFVEGVSAFVEGRKARFTGQ